MKNVNVNRIICVLKELMKTASTYKGKKEIKLKFNEKLKSSKGIDGIINKLKVMYSYFLDPQVLSYKKVIIGAVLLYFINPGDVMPDLIPAIGFLDDAVAVLYGWNLLQDELDDYIESKRSIIVDGEEVTLDVDYSIKEEINNISGEQKEGETYES